MTFMISEMRGILIFRISFLSIFEGFNLRFNSQVHVAVYGKVNDVF